MPIMYVRDPETGRFVPVGGGGGSAIDDTTPSTETTYSSSKIDELLNAQKEAIDEQLDSLNEDKADKETVTKITDLFNWGGTSIKPASTNLLNPAEIEYGKYLTAGGVMGPNSNYMVTGFIPVNANDRITVQYDYPAGIPLRQIRFIHRVTAYNAEKVIMPSVGTDVVIANAPYIVPEGVSYIRLTIYVLADYSNYAVCNSETVLPYEEYCAESVVTTETELKPSVYVKIKNGYTADVGANWTAATENHDLCGYTMSYRADIPNGLTALEFGKGKGKYLGGYVKVDPTNVSVYFGEGESTTYSYPHGLTFADYICVQLTVGYDAEVKIKITTNGGTYEKDGLLWSGVRRGAFFSTCAEAVNAKIAYSAPCWNTDSHIYGDSYLAAKGDDRWTHYLLQDGTTNVLLNAYSGRGSKEALLVLKDVMQYCKRPERIVWCLGMNDGDNGAVNANWQSCVEELMTICENESIELILSTIPNVATVDNTYKNTYVRDSGYRYIDFAAAVGASSDAEWYSNMLSSDGVHPDVQGAIALYTQAVIDVPELLD